MFVMYCVNGASCSSLLIETTDSMILLLLSITYVQQLISKGNDIIVLKEHLLWPFKLYNLESIHPDFSFTAIADKRLNSSSELTRGCGWVAIIWKKSLKASPLNFACCDRRCGIQIELRDTGITLNILSVYMPSSDKSVDIYNNNKIKNIKMSYLDIVEQAICQLSCKGPLLVVGDLNAHLGSNGSSGLPNSRGCLWNKIIEEQYLLNSI